MKIIRIHALRGPNIWSRYPVLDALVDLEELRDSPSNTLPGLCERLSTWIPSLIEHQCSTGERGGFLQRLREGTWPGHILEHVTLELQNLAGTPTSFGKTRETSTPGIYNVVVRYVEERLGRACLMAGREILLAAIHDRPVDIPAELARLRELAGTVCLGPSARAVVDAAEAQGIPARRLNDGSLVLLGQGCWQRRIWTSETDRTSAIAESIAQDKQLTLKLLCECGVPVPEGRVVSSPADAWAAAEEMGLPVVVKPRDGHQGRGVFLGLTAQWQVEHAFAMAVEEESPVMVECMVPGNGYRLLVVDGCMVAAATSEPAVVVGDGRTTVLSLIDSQINAMRHQGHGKYPALDLTNIDPVVRFELDRQGIAPNDVPAAGVRILIQQRGSVVHDVTDEVHPEVAEKAVLAARVVGLNLAGIDLVATEINQPLETQGGAIVEVNAGPGLHIHLAPSSGKPRPVGEAVLRGLFNPGDTGRIPLTCIMGTNGKTVVARMLDCMLLKSHHRVGLACSDGIFHEGRLARAGNRTGAASARDVLLDPAVDAAVIEASAEGVAKEGVGFDRCDIAVVTNLGQNDHLDSGIAESSDGLFDILRCAVDVLLPTGTAVLNGDDPLAADMARLSSGNVILFSCHPNSPVMIAEMQAGRRAVVLLEGRIVLAHGKTVIDIADASALPLAASGRFGFQVENGMAAAAAAWALGISPDIIRGVLLSFGADWRDAPGRGNLFNCGGVTVVIDRAPNARAAASLAQGLEGMRARRRVVAACDGYNGDNQKRERWHGTLSGALGNSILFGANAIEEALSSVSKGDLLVLLVDGIRIDSIVAVVQKRLGPSGSRRPSSN